MTLGIVVGMATEARIARRLGTVAIGGGLPAGAEIAADSLAANGATALLSFGLAGGLDPALRPGTLIVPTAVLDAGRRYPTDPELSAWLGGPTADLLLAADAIIAGRQEKRALFEQTTASAVDLESGAVARIAARHALPFAVLRVICDPAERTLPEAAITALDAQGQIAPGRLAKALLRRPWEMLGLIALGRDAKNARQALIRKVGSAGQGPGGPCIP